MATVEVPDELLERLAATKLGTCDPAKRVAVAVGIVLHQSDEISGSHAAQLAGIPYRDYLDILYELGFPAVTYNVDDYRDDLKTLERIRAERRRE